MTFDAIASRTHGALSVRDVRIVWDDGTLYVVHTNGDVAAFATEAPKKVGGMWTVQIGEAALRFQPPGCGSCRARVQSSVGGQMSLQAIRDRVAVDA